MHFLSHPCELPTYLILLDLITPVIFSEEYNFSCPLYIYFSILFFFLGSKQVEQNPEQGNKKYVPSLCTEALNYRTLEEGTQKRDVT
jgi:hypothetical protein